MNTYKTIWEGRVIKTPFSDFTEDAKHLKLKRINKKRKIGSLLEIVPKNTNTKVFLYQLRDTRMEGIWRNQCLILQPAWDIIKRGLTTSDVTDIEVNFVVKLRAQNIDTHSSIHNYFWMKMIKIPKNNYMISITRKQWKITWCWLKKNLFHFCWCLYAWLWMLCVSVSSVFC